MAKVYDILLDENFDLAVVDGDFVLGESTQQHQELLLLINKGELKEFPLAGVGLNEYLLDDGEMLELTQEICKQFSVDGMKVGEIELSGESIKINAEYI
ncbi:MAG: oxidase [Bacteroidetes bacterium]|nr:oxidase [Bacteroidota bacterium]